MAVSDKYTIANNTYTQVAKADPKDRLEIEIGDSKQPDFYPQVKIQRWDNEVNASFRLLDNEPKQLTTEGDTIKLIGAPKEVHERLHQLCVLLPNIGVDDDHFRLYGDRALGYDDFVVPPFGNVH
ncbi:hypothetical protein LCGC14_2289150 [marine sediment metagenome]|uniref:Uncharacterized protein n=1 Tax=marine sediment metagenome TaxID=412755 RepID=A0A0F9CS88_9ZZZZ